MKIRYKSYCTIKELIQNSILFEEETANFYKKMKSYTDNEKTDDLLKFLIEQEYMHKNKLENITFAYDSHAMIQFPPEFEQAFPVDIGTSISFSVLLDTAIEIEVFSQKIYHEAGFQSMGEIKELFMSLAQYEKTHEQYLRELELF